MDRTDQPRKQTTVNPEPNRRTGTIHPPMTAHMLARIGRTYCRLRAGHYGGVLMRHFAILVMSFVVVAVLLSACTAAAGEVVFHDFDPDADDPWVGLVVEQGPGPEFVFLADGTQPLGLSEGDPLGWHFNGSVVVTEERGSPGRVLSRAELIEVTDAPPGETASVEMVWLGLQGDDPAQYELQAALEHQVVEGFHLHAECYTIDTNDFAVALIDNELQPIAAWGLNDRYANFVEIAEDQVRCETQIID
jgi:hypothetical protein